MGNLFFFISLDFLNILIVISSQQSSAINPNDTKYRAIGCLLTVMEANFPSWTN